mmetsp:Transcript_44129/g.140561  ORF Transcript_44129/g.140561 Transcript_44129/m.140561 type:complete len:245 (+) Transcript_44129:497-1231(+)
MPCSPPCLHGLLCGYLLCLTIGLLLGLCCKPSPLRCRCLPLKFRSHELCLVPGLGPNLQFGLCIGLPLCLCVIAQLGGTILGETPLAIPSCARKAKVCLGEKARSLVRNVCTSGRGCQARAAAPAHTRRAQKLLGLVAVNERLQVLALRLLGEADPVRPGPAKAPLHGPLAELCCIVLAAAVLHTDMQSRRVLHKPDCVSRMAECRAARAPCPIGQQKRPSSMSGTGHAEKPFTRTVCSGQGTE